MTRYSKPEYLTDFSSDPTIWTRRFGDEYWADAYTPLSYCLLRHWISNISLPPSKKVHNKFRFHKGFAYASSEYWLDVMSGVPPSSRLPSIRAYLCKKDQERFDNLPARLGKILVFIFKMTPFYRRSPTDAITKNHIAMNEWQVDTGKAFQELADMDLSARSVDDLLDLFTTWKEKGDYHFVLLRAGQAAWGPLLTQTLEKLLGKWISKEAAQKANQLMSGLPGSFTLETNKDIHGLAAAVTGSALEDLILSENGASQAMGYINAHPEDEFSKLFNRFVRKYPHRGSAREMIADRWEERPEMIIDLMCGLVGGASLHDPVAEENEKRTTREQFQTEIIEALQQAGGSFIKIRILRWVLKMAQAYYLFRENQRFTLDQILYALKQISLAIGRRYAQKGLLDHHQNIFFLFEDELFDLAKEPEYRDEIKQDAVDRSNLYPSQVGNFPPTFLQGHREFEEIEEGGSTEAVSSMETDGVTVFEGLAVSAGIASGKARVVTRIEEIGQIQKGEILVSSNTDPAWTPAFLNLAGLVMETGGVLCHGAIVSREYGIPAVTFISQATRIIKTGQQIEVDGDAGIIRILDGAG